MQKIKTWADLDGLESGSHFIRVEDNCCGWVIDKKTGNDVDYLSTHTFYKRSGIVGKGALSKYGFDIEIVSDED